MGSQVSVSIENLVMENVEVKAICSYDFPPKIWKRYVDDVCTALKERPDTTFTDHLNPIGKSINITVELESNNKLAFLDTQIQYHQDGNFTTRVHRKKTQKITCHLTHITP